MQVANARQHLHFKMERFDFVLTVCFISDAFSLYEYNENGDLKTWKTEP